jgi:PadR family transcriptional regulator PadR
MGKQATEMLKGTLEGIVLGVLRGRPAYGYEITSWLREQGFTDIAEGTIYALLLRIEQRGYVDITKEPSEKGPPRKVYTLNDAGARTLDEFWSNWSFLAERIEDLRASGVMSPADAQGRETAPTEITRIEGEHS